MAVLKNPFEIGRNEKFLHEPAAGHGIFDFVANKGAIVLLGKSVFVHPERVGTSGLAIDEAMGRLPDFGSRSASAAVCRAGAANSRQECPRALRFRGEELENLSARLR